MRGPGSNALPRYRAKFLLVLLALLALSLAGCEAGPLITFKSAVVIGTTVSPVQPQANSRHRRRIRPGVPVILALPTRVRTRRTEK